MKKIIEQVSLVMLLNAYEEETTQVVTMMSAVHDKFGIAFNYDYLLCGAIDIYDVPKNIEQALVEFIECY